VGLREKRCSCPSLACSSRTWELVWPVLISAAGRAGAFVASVALGSGAAVVVAGAVVVGVAAGAVVGAAVAAGVLGAAVVAGAEGLPEALSPSGPHPASSATASAAPVAAADTAARRLPRPSSLFRALVPLPVDMGRYSPRSAVVHA
jgi:hypothetical protein